VRDMTESAELPNSGSAKGSAAAVASATLRAAARISGVIVDKRRLVLGYSMGPVSGRYGSKFRASR